MCAVSLMFEGSVSSFIYIYERTNIQVTIQVFFFTIKTQITEVVNIYNIYMPLSQRNNDCDSSGSLCATFGTLSTALPLKDPGLRLMEWKISFYPITVSVWMYPSLQEKGRVCMSLNHIPFGNF